LEENKVVDNSGYEGQTSHMGTVENTVNPYAMSNYDMLSDSKLG
tara:strand:+ start:1233 stop:1364 length:132 start_codon:yes stop_codon:yes gene_type:complete